MKDKIYNSLAEAQFLLQQFISDAGNIEKMSLLAEQISHIFLTGGKVLICGNGGSACDAMHFAEEFTGRFRKDRKPLPVIAFTDSSHITCVGNDYGFDEIFSRAVEAYVQPGDLVIGISTSGNSPNIIKALHKAGELHAFTFSLLGKDGGKLKGLCDGELIIAGNTSDRIQEIHMLVLHTVIEMVERNLFPDLY
jgi:D-sedoheptulose 7-phosphate isomerase